MEEATILTLVGMPGAGKSYCVDYLKQKGLPSVYFGGVVVDETMRRYGKVDEEHEKIVREDLRATEGKGAVATRIIAQIEQLVAQGQKQIVADGLYSWTEYKIFKEHWGNRAVIIAITAPRHLRHERLLHRPVRPYTEAEATAREYAEIENLEKGGPIANADYTIVNEGTPDDMIAHLDTILTELHI
jgi:dephospho-CoA kinase